MFFFTQGLGAAVGAGMGTGVWLGEGSGLGLGDACELGEGLGGWGDGEGLGGWGEGEGEGSTEKGCAREQQRGRQEGHEQTLCSGLSGGGIAAC